MIQEILTYIIIIWAIYRFVKSVIPQKKATNTSCGYSSSCGGCSFNKASNQGSVVVKPVRL